MRAQVAFHSRTHARVHLRAGDGAKSKSPSQLYIKRCLDSFAFNEILPAETIVCLFVDPLSVRSALCAVFRRNRYRLRKIPNQQAIINGVCVELDIPG